MLWKILQELSIEYTLIKHPPVITAVEAIRYYEQIDAGKSKNLFLCNKNKTQYYLVIIDYLKKMNLKKLANSLSEKKLSFASIDNLKKKLNLSLGSVSPFGLVYDKKHRVNVIIDKNLSNYKKLTFHPNDNSLGIIISYNDFIKYLNWTQNNVTFLTI